MVYSIPSAWSNKKSFTSSAYGRWNDCKMANAFNNIFIRTVKDLRDGIVDSSIEDPLNRLMRWLGKPEENIPKLKSDKTNGETYRPVSNIIFILQVYEKAVF